MLVRVNFRRPSGGSFEGLLNLSTVTRVYPADRGGSELRIMGDSGSYRVIVDESRDDLQELEKATMRGRGDDNRRGV